VLPEAVEALHRAVTASRVTLTVPGVGGRLDWSPSGVFVTEGPENKGVIDIRDATTGASELKFQAHNVDVNDVAFSADGSMLATTGDDGALKVWDPATGDNLLTLHGSGEVWAPTFSLDGSLVAAGWPNHIRVFDVTKGRVVRTFPWGLDAAFSPDGRLLAEASFDNVTVRDIETGEITFTLTLEGRGADGFLEVAWAPDGRRIATGHADGTVRMWDGRSGEPQLTLFGHRSLVTSLDWSPDGSRLLTGSEDGTAKVWEVTEPGRREQLSLSAEDMRAGVNAAVFSPDGTQVMTSDSAITSTKVWDVGIGGDAEWMNLPAQSGWVNPYFSGDVQFLPDGRHLASTVDEGIAIWDLWTGRTIRMIPIEGSLVSSFDVTADGSTIVAGLQTQAQKGLATAWDVSTGEKLFSVHFNEGVGDVDWSPDGKHFVTTTQGGSPKIYDDTGHLVRTLDEQGDLALYSARFSPDGRFIVTARGPWRGGSQDYRQTIWDSERGEVVNTIEPGNGWNAAILAIFDPTGARVATNGSKGAPRIWDVETGRSLVTMSAHRGPPWDIAFSPDGSRVATADADGTVRLFDATSGEQVLSLPGHERTVTRLAFSPDGTMLASKGEDGTVRIWALDLDDLLRIARQQVKRRTLTNEECLQYLHVSTCPAG
jgi:WD40 repeat protein